MRAVNLLPTDLRGATKTTAELSAAPEASGGAGPVLVLGVLAACVAGAAGYVLAGNTVKQRQSELASVKAQQQAIAGRVAALKPFADFDAKAQSRTQTVRDLAGSRFDWEQVLGDLARAVPADVTLSSVAGDVSSDTGSSSDPLRGSISAPAITLAGCAPDQTAVASLMARLRDIDGVTRVSLSKSDDVKATVSGGAQTRADRASAPCGTGSHPAFQMVAFFQNAAAAVSAPPAGTAGVTATPTATPTPTATATPAGSSASTTSTDGATK